MRRKGLSLTFLFIFLFSYIIPVSSLQTNSIIESHDIGIISQFTKPETLIVFDLDNTLIETKQTLGSDQWYNDFLKQQQSKHSSFESALMHALNYYDLVHNVTNVCLVDTRTPNILTELEKQGILILGLTTRGARLKDVTLKQLSSVHIQFNIRNKYKEDYIFQKEKKGGVHSGIIFVAGANKGDCLVEYLDYLKWHPKHIVFIDDKLKNVADVQAAIEKKGISFTGIRYSYLDNKVKAYNDDLEHHRNITDIQLEHINKIISDEDAKAILLARKQRKVD